MKKVIGRISEVLFISPFRSGTTMSEGKLSCLSRRDLVSYGIVMDESVIRNVRMRWSATIYNTTKT